MEENAANTVNSQTHNTSRCVIPLATLYHRQIPTRIGQVGDNSLEKLIGVGDDENWKTRAENRTGIPFSYHGEIGCRQESVQFVRFKITTRRPRCLDVRERQEGERSNTVKQD